MTQKIDDSGSAYPLDPQVTRRAEHMGLTKREVAAIAALQGILAGYWSNSNMDGINPTALAQEAVANADALITALGEDQ